MIQAPIHLIHYVAQMGGSVSPSYILDNYSINAAYSIRKLTNKTTPILRVRRSNDNAEQDVYTPQEALSFCGANTGFVTTWYDQGPNNINAVQSVAAQQPYICSGGSLFTLSGAPSLMFYTNAHLSASISIGSSGTNFGALVVGNRFENVNRAYFGGATGCFKFRNAVTGAEIVRNNVSVVLNKPDTTTGLKIIMASYDGSLTRLVVNKLTEATTATHLATTANVLRIGGSGDSTVLESLSSNMADCIFLNNSDAYPALHQAYLNLYGVV